jgi:hypothetical protein
VGQQSVLSRPPSCQTSNVVGTELPFCLDDNVNVHNNYITNNSSLGDELFSGTLSGGGGATFCTGADDYKFNYNWVCGNLASGEGGGMVHLGFIYHGDIEHNTIALNQSNKPTIPTNGGGIQVMGTPDTDSVCGTISDADCPPGLSDGTGPGLVINGNLILEAKMEGQLRRLDGTEHPVGGSRRSFLLACMNTCTASDTSTPACGSLETGFRPASSSSRRRLTSSAAAHEREPALQRYCLPF